MKVPRPPTIEISGLESTRSGFELAINTGFDLLATDGTEPVTKAGPELAGRTELKITAGDRH